MSSMQTTPKADTSALPRQLDWTIRLFPPPAGQPYHFCLDDFRFLPFYRFSFRDFRQAEHKVKILFLIWNLQVSHFAFQGWSGVKAFLRGAVCSATGSQGHQRGWAPDLSPVVPRPVWT